MSSLEQGDVSIASPPQAAAGLLDAPTTATTTADAHRQVIHRYVEAFNRGDFEAVRGLFTEDAVVQGVLGWGTLDVVMPIWREIHEAFRIHLTVEDIAADGDQVAVRYSERGTFTTPFRGQAPTGKGFEVVAMEWFTFRDGRIERRWGARDHAAQARQMGMPLG